MKQYKKGTWRLSQVPFLYLKGWFWLGYASYSLPAKPILGCRLCLNNRQHVFRRFSGLKTRYSGLSGVSNLYGLIHRSPHMPTPTPKKSLISHTSVQHCFDKIRSGLETLRGTDPCFPRPIKLGSNKQAELYFVVAEVEAWLESKISEGNGSALDLAGREAQWPHMGRYFRSWSEDRTQRLQLAVYPDDVRELRYIDRWPNKIAVERFAKVIEQLDQRPGKPHSAIRFTPEAQTNFIARYTCYMQKSRSEHLHPTLQFHYRKCRKALLVWPFYLS